MSIKVFFQLLKKYLGNWNKKNQFDKFVDLELVVQVATNKEQAHQQQVVTQKLQQLSSYNQLNMSQFLSNRSRCHQNNQFWSMRFQKQVLLFNLNKYSLRILLLLSTPFWPSTSCRGLGLWDCCFVWFVFFFVSVGKSQVETIFYCC